MTLQFDEAYYRRFYKDPSTRVYDQKRHAKLVSGIVGLIEWFGLELTDVLDVGAGLGWWGQWLKRHRKGVTVVSTELCRSRIPISVSDAPSRRSPVAAEWRSR